MQILQGMIEAKDPDLNQVIQNYYKQARDTVKLRTDVTDLIYNIFKANDEDNELNTESDQKLHSKNMPFESKNNNDFAYFPDRQPYIKNDSDDDSKRNL